MGFQSCGERQKLLLSMAAVAAKAPPTKAAKAAASDWLKRAGI